VEQLMTVRRADVGVHAVVRVTGEVDAMTAPRLAAAVTAAFDGDRPVVVDLTGVTFLDSAGLAALVQVTERGERRGEPLRIVVDHTRPVLRPIQLTGLDDRLALYESVEDATARSA
jgi:anti-sigma B factor antagonist